MIFIMYVVVLWFWLIFIALSWWNYFSLFRRHMSAFDFTLHVASWTGCLLIFYVSPQHWPWILHMMLHWSFSLNQDLLLFISRFSYNLLHIYLLKSNYIFVCYSFHVSSMLGSLVSQTTHLFSRASHALSTYPVLSILTACRFAHVSFLL